MHLSTRLYSILGFCALSIALTPHQASAFCGFYVGGADASLYNDATMVVLMRDGTRTVLSMQNTYEGPPEGFALVIPVPEVLQEENVRTLPASVFERVDRLAAPRLVEYWEQDPCAPPPPRPSFARSGRRPSAMSASRRRMDEGTGVTVEAEFAVGEYDIVVLSAEESNGLERWLVQENYNIPAGAGETLAPYVQLGTKFFVAKVDPARVTFSEGRARLSPLRFHYDDERLALPIRLGLLNSRGTQNLIVHVLAKGTRYEAANYPNVTIPTNLIVANNTRDQFGGFYRSIFDRVTEQNPGAVVTEYSWSAMSCDPCPEPALRTDELRLLGSDVMPPDIQGGMHNSRGRVSRDWVLTRLHHRYGPEGATRDLVFREARPIVGGRGMPDADGKLEEQHSAAGASYNNFQGRYVMLHPWEGRLACANPSRGRWGGPPSGAAPRPTSPPLALAPRTGAPVDLAQAVASEDQRFLVVSATPAEEPNVGVLPDSAPGPSDHDPAPIVERQPQPQPAPRAMPVAPRGGCAGCAAGSANGSFLALFAFLALGWFWRRR